MARNNLQKHPTLWKDRKHFMWFPLSFTKYELKHDRLYEETGFFNSTHDELLLYRVVDLTLRQTIWQKLFNTGTVILKAPVDSTPVVRLENIHDPIAVKELLSDLIEEAIKSHKVISREYSAANGCDKDGDGYNDCGHDHHDHYDHDDHGHGGGIMW